MEPVLACPECGQPVQPEDHFCGRCAYPLRQSCRVCRQEALIWARFCPNCGAVFALPGARREESTERQILVGFGLPEGAQMPAVPGAPAAPQVGAPGVPGGSAIPQAGAPGVPTASAPPQSGAPGVHTAPAGPQGGPPHVASMPGGPQAGTALRMAGHAAGKTAGRSLGSKLLGMAATKAITAVVAVAVVATGTFAIAAATGHNPFAGASQKPASYTGAGGVPSPTATPPAPSEVTYIGGDGNIWEMMLPGGTPKQLTSDAKAGNPNNGVGSISYYGLAWSPDGSMLAVVRAVGVSGFPGSNAELRVLAADGSLLWKQAMPEPPINDSLAWSPDSRFIAYRQGTSNYNANGDEQGKLVIVDAHTGAAASTLKYNAGGVGCGGGGFSALELLIWAAHHAYAGIDSFAWSSDGQELLVSSGCADQEAAAVARSSGATTAGYPAGASFQPGGQLILGTAAGNTGVVLELTNLAGQQSRVLASITGPSGSQSYAEGLGQGSWSSDGKTIYYEYQDGIWRINADGSGAQQIIAGSQATNGQATVGLVPRLSPDGKRLLYLEARGAWLTSNGVATGQWYIAQADGSSALALPDGAIGAQHYIFEAVWRPGR